MRNVCKPSTVSVAAVVGGVGLLLVVMVAGISSRPAEATPAFAGQTGKACGYCHVNAAGGGKLTAQGQKFKARGNK